MPADCKSQAEIAIPHICADRDAGWLFDALAASPIRRDVKISRATHLMHLEANRYALYREAEAFLLAGDIAPAGE